LETSIKVYGKKGKNLQNSRNQPVTWEPACGNRLKCRPVTGVQKDLGNGRGGKNGNGGGRGEGGMDGGRG